MIVFVIGSGLREVCGDQATLGLSFIREARTAPIYRLYEIEERFAALLQVAEGGISVPGEICSIDVENVEEFLQGEPEGLQLMPVMLDDKTTVLGSVSTLETLPQRSSDISGYGSFETFYSERQNKSLQNLVD